MATIAERIGLDRIREVADTVRDQLLEVETGNADYDTKVRTWADTLETQAYLVHQAMFALARPNNDPKTKAAWPYVYHGYVVTLLKELFGDELMGREHRRKKIREYLHNYGYAKHPGRGPGARWLLKNWGTPPVDTGLTPARSTIVHVEQQAKKAEEVAGPVTTHFDLSLIPIPNPLTPDTVLEYVRNISASWRRLNNDRARMQKEIDELTAELAELRSAATHSEWAPLRDKIIDAIGGNNNAV